MVALSRGLNIPPMHNNAHAIASQLGLQDRRASKVLPAPHEIPHQTDSSKPGKHNTGVVHCRGSQISEHGWHAEDDNRQRDPAQCDNVNSVAKLSERVRCVCHGLAAPHDRDKDGQRIGCAEADGSHTREAVECSRGAKVDETQQAVNQEGQGQAPQRNVEALVDAAPQARAGNGAVTGEGVGAPAGGGEGTNAGEQPDAEDEEQEAEATAGATGCGLEDEADGLAVGDGEQLLDVGQDEEHGNEVQQASDAGGDDREHDGLGDLALGALDLLAHGGHHAVAGQHVGGLQQADEEGPPGGPSGAGGVKVGEDELAAAPAAAGHGQQHDEDDDDRGAGPPDAQCVDLVEISAAEDVDEVCDQHDGPEHEDRLPRSGDKVLAPESDAAEDELCAAEVDGECYGPVTDQGEPACHALITYL